VCCWCCSEAAEDASSTAVDGPRAGGRADVPGRRGWPTAGRSRPDDDQGGSDADTLDDSLLGDSDENGGGGGGGGGGGRGGGRARPSRGPRHAGRGHQRVPPRHSGGPGSSTYRIFIALFDYNPATMSPNRGAVDEELAFYEGQLLKVRQHETLCVYLRRRTFVPRSIRAGPL